ncbi:TonB-dependent receptor plug domain-containing protein [Sphingomonas sp. CD22]|uniref:TonB-dependent receptor domain-containing protein n=1 Tax=Sphingomonas sp. CD22 TaxID=3100214 RepID=UPI002ADFF85E|nr:TonB-dependent receptor [Sphingomonas sp. CD22]MEA1084439.1 TonB-dependent receptor plug domain-containing protein [Sphingomonas sp. CD22]
MTRGRTTGGLRGRCAAIVVWRATWLGATALAGVVAPAMAAAQEAQAHDFAITAGPLGDALTAFAQQSGLTVGATTDDILAAASPGVSGQLTAEAALARLLAGTGFTGRLRGGRVTIERLPAPAAADTITTDALRVEGQQSADTGSARDARGYDDIYDRDASSSYAGKVEVERYKGVSTSDVLRGMVNVYSGDARNSGALDPSIRGIQGPGRVPVIVDGTEQALTVWRGYNGASNRNYIDPSLIAGIQVLKGPVSDRDVHGSTGGAVVIKTLNVGDILKPGQHFGIEIHVEGGDNSTAPRLPTLLTGQDYRTVLGFPGAKGTPQYSNPAWPYDDPSLRIHPRTSDDNNLLSTGDRALRVAAAGRLGDIDLIGAYAYRDRGNYFAGRTGAGYYSHADLPDTADTYLRRMALEYKPGDEVSNTSSRLESWLGKASWHIAPDQYLQFGFRDSSTAYGEIMPSRITVNPTLGIVQWPLSHVHMQAYNAEYKWRPDTPWLDLKANLWATRTASHTYTRGGFPNSASISDPILMDTGINSSQNNRVGFTGSNKIRLGSAFDMIVSGNWQHEKLTSSDDVSTSASCNFCQFPRKGRREEHRIALDAEWRPTRFLKLNTGLAWSGYWAVDDLLRGQIDAGNAKRFTRYAVSHYEFFYRGIGQSFFEADYRSRYAGLPSDVVNRRIQENLPAYLARPREITVNKAAQWLPGADGRYGRADNICLNGIYANMPGATGHCAAAGITDPFVPTLTDTRHSGDGWTPSASATVFLSDSSRAYVRYAEVLRFPSMFESTLGFSASFNPLARLKPEHGYFREAAYIQDLRDLLALKGKDQRADLKLTWYRNTTHDVVERNTSLMFSNIERQVIEGLELQARYDDGRFFSDVSAAHMLVNKVCDESAALQRDPIRWRVPTCVKYGFPGGYLLTQATPENSANWTAGGRFLDKRLELGGRLIWYGAYRNRQLDDLIGGPLEKRINGYSLNIPFSWGETVTADAYASLRLNDRFSAEIVGTNLNNRYFADPLTRSLVPAPGRTIRISLTGRI